ncbi:MAG TPA: glycosyltransferase family 2 protein [Puia sp.]|nr:glycosyltransferase family 2 protein [Puia sp.]
MLLSVIIVNYNVKYFLEQCLCSLEKSLLAAGLQTVNPVSDVSADTPFSTASAEIFVVDNHSSDGSMEWLPPRFPGVQFIDLQDNIGFGRANNHALAKAGGKYILFLNPDTVLAEDSLLTILTFMESAPAAGAAGVRMIDGGGRFLKESRRGFPSPWVAFCKLAGLTALFPRSPRFAEYYLGYLPETQNHPAPILSGACMTVRKAVLEITGGFDEQFFLYAEDIDLSYRIGQAGYTNYYIADTTILHYKGESTFKDARYVKLFYKAMSQFRRKHFKGALPFLYDTLMEAAIWSRAALTAIENLFMRKNRTTGGPGLRTWVGGEPADARRLMDLLSRGDRRVVSDPAQASEIIYCEGAHFPFKKIIEAMQEDGGGQVIYKIHAAAGAAAVGSHSKDERGETLFFPPKA